MTLRRLPDSEQLVDRKRCPHAEHNPPAFVSLPAGSYIHTCPLCGNSVRIEVSGPHLSAAHELAVSHVAPIASACAAELASLRRTLAACPTPEADRCVICDAAKLRLAELAEPLRGES